jgi:tetratricopeptide (TPR) repeat protein
VSQEWLSHLHSVLEERLSNKDFIFTHCGGLAGIGWLYEYLSQRKIIDYDTNVLLEEFDGCLEKELIRFLCQGNYDFLHGGVGVALYFIKRALKKNESVLVLNRFLKDLEKIGDKQQDGFIKWLSLLNADTFQQGYNISLSHGMASIAALLSKLYNIEGIDKKRTVMLLRGIVQYILAQEINKDKYGSYFTNFALESMHDIFKSRLAWCYGDLGIASVLYQAGKTLQENAWIEKALEILTFTATQRRNLQDNYVSDACLCHGTSGIEHIFYRMWWNTKLPQFKDAADYWFEQTLKMARFEDGLAGFKTWQTPKYGGWVNVYGLLEGISGIGLAMLSYITETEPTWDECLLLS